MPPKRKILFLHLLIIYSPSCCSKPLTFFLLCIITYVLVCLLLASDLYILCTTQTWMPLIRSVFNRLGRGTSEQSEHPAPHLPGSIPTRQCDARRWAAHPHSSSLPLFISHHTCSVTVDYSLNHSYQSRIMSLTDKKLPGLFSARWILCVPSDFYDCTDIYFGCLGLFRARVQCGLILSQFSWL